MLIFVYNSSIKYTLGYIIYPICIILSDVISTFQALIMKSISGNETLYIYIKAHYNIMYLSVYII